MTLARGPKNLIGTSLTAGGTRLPLIFWKHCKSLSQNLVIGIRQFARKLFKEKKKECDSLVKRVSLLTMCSTTFFLPQGEVMKLWGMSDTRVVCVGLIYSG